jgi:hypothetical protein
LVLVGNVDGPYCGEVSYTYGTSRYSPLAARTLCWPAISKSHVKIALPFSFFIFYYYYFILFYSIFFFNLFFLRGSPCSACSYIVMATSLFPRPLATHQRIRLASNTESKWADASLLSTTLMYPLFAHSSPAPKPALASFPSSLPSFLVFFF